SSFIGRRDTRRTITAVIVLLALALFSETWISPKVFERFLHLEFAGRVFVAAALLFPLGFLMGMPFALGLRLINMTQPDEESARQLTAWAWGINGYFTVIGSAGTVFIALFFGFQAALVTAALGYLVGGIALRSITQRAAAE